MARRSTITRTYFAKTADDGTPIVLYRSVEGPSYLQDTVLNPDGWVPTLVLNNWRFGEANDVDIITRKEAKATATEWGVGRFIK
tara:strand:+ start:5132 stop:5383 length:252 start_codon:yes stop_codon:yes gene_type:complete